MRKETADISLADLHKMEIMLEEQAILVYTVYVLMRFLIIHAVICDLYGQTV